MKGVILRNMEARLAGGKARLHLFSGHDSSLLAVMGAFALDTPPQWPEYGATLYIELLKQERVVGREIYSSEDYFVRFTLNGNLLSCALGLQPGEEPRELVPLDVLEDALSSWTSGKYLTMADEASPAEFEGVPSDEQGPYVEDNEIEFDFR